MKDLLLTIARESIREEIIGRKLIKKSELLNSYPALHEARATFVTLTIEGELRGCIGSLVPHRTLLEDLISNAKSAAFKDPRFLPLSKEEFSHIEIEISLLSLPQKVPYESVDELRSKIRPKQDGVILNLEGRQSTFLPQVWDQLEAFDLFFAHLCQKAGLSSDCLEQHPLIQTYQVEKIS